MIPLSKSVSFLQLHQREEFELPFQVSYFPSGICLERVKHTPLYEFNYFGTRIPVNFMELPAPKNKTCFELARGAPWYPPEILPVISLGRTFCQD
jgi:hypothetical protein